MRAGCCCLLNRIYLRAILLFISSISKLRDHCASDRRIVFFRRFPCYQSRWVHRLFSRWRTGKLQQDFGISVGKSDFLDLDSSTAKKFSRHLIVHLPGDQVIDIALVKNKKSAFIYSGPDNAIERRRLSRVESGTA